MLPLHHRPINLAEAVRFELTDPFEPAVFKTAAISRTLPRFLNLVEYPGIEPGMSKTADLQSTASPLMLLLHIGAQGETRTLNPFGSGF